MKPTGQTRPCTEATPREMPLRESFQRMVSRGSKMDSSRFDRTFTRKATEIDSLAKYGTFRSHNAVLEHTSSWQRQKQG